MDAVKPWYREPWPWILMAGPAVVVVAGGITASLAVTSFDGMVSDSYYKEGLAVNREISRQGRAIAMGLEARVQFDAERSRVRVFLAGADAPAALELRLVHPTVPAQDRVATLDRTAPGLYEGSIGAPRGRSMHVSLEDSAHRWLLRGEWRPGSRELTLGGG